MKQMVEIIIDKRYNEIEVYDLNENYLGSFKTIEEVKEIYEVI